MLNKIKSDHNWSELQEAINNSEFDKAERFLQSIRLELASPTDLCLWHYQSAVLMHKKGNFGEAIKFLEEQVNKIPDDCDSIIKYEFLDYLAKLYFQQGNNVKSLQIFEHILSTLDQLSTNAVFDGNKVYKADALFMLGKILWIGGDLPKALHYFQRNLVLRRILGDKNTIAIALNHVGIIYHAQGHLQKALELFKDIFGLQDFIQEQETLAAFNINMGHIYFEKSQFLLAEKRYQEAFRLRKQSKDAASPGIAESIFHLAKVQVELGTYESNALVLMQHFPRPSQNMPIISTYRQLVDFLVQRTNKRWKVATETLEQVLLVESLEYGLQVYCYEALAELGLLQWLEDKNDLLLLTNAYSKLDALKKMALKNNLVASLSKAYLFQGQLSLATNQYKDALVLLNDSLGIANRYDLELVKRLAHRELYNVRIKMEEEKENLSNEPKSIDELKIKDLQNLLRHFSI